MHCDSINPASMKSQGADAVKRANLPVYTISSNTEALAPALQKPLHSTPPPHPPSKTCLQECSCWTKWFYHLGLLFHLCCCFSWNPFQAVSPPTQAKFEKWEKGTMQSGHILQPAVKWPGRWTISHLPPPTMLQILHLHKAEGQGKLSRKCKTERKWSLNGRRD